MIPKVKQMLKDRLHLDFHEWKLIISSVWLGVEFLGSWIKPNRTCISRNSVGRISMKLDNLAMSDTEKWCATLNSYCGLLSHSNNYNLMYMLLRCTRDFDRYGVFDIKLRHFYSKEELKKRVEGNLCKIGEGERDLYF